jgi:hypothetical protein
VVNEVLFAAGELGAEVAGTALFLFFKDAVLSGSENSALGQFF